MGLVWVLCLCGLLAVQFGESHVVLTFPPARKYALDFLDDFKLPKTPCGMPKGPGPYTSILSGSTFNITWDLAYPHKGGFKLEVLDPQERPVMDLTPIVGGSRFLSFDTTAQGHRVKIPNEFECQGCTVRLLRQAEDWNQNYMFKSCADIDIVRGNYKENCMGNGVFRDNRCECSRLFTGPRCQYKDECWDDSDCGRHGHCINIEGTNYPKKQCFCELGWFGNKCEKESSIKTTELNLKQYSRRDLAIDFKLYWKILKDLNEIEVVLRARGTSYVALGWRPLGLSAECKAFPALTFPIVQIDTHTDVRRGKELSGSKENVNILTKPDDKTTAQVTEAPKPSNPITSTSVAETSSEIINATDPTVAGTILVSESSETSMTTLSTAPVTVSVIPETTTIPTTTSTTTPTTTTTTTTTTAPSTTTTSTTTTTMTTTTTTETPTETTIPSTESTPEFSIPPTPSVRRLHRPSTRSPTTTKSPADDSSSSSSSTIKSTIRLEGQETIAVPVKQTNKVSTTTQRNLYPSRKVPLLHHRSSKRPPQTTTTATTTTTTTTEQPTTATYEDEEYEEELEGHSPEVQDETEISVESSTVNLKSTPQVSRAESVIPELEEVTVVGSEDSSFGQFDGIVSHEMEHSGGVEVKSYSSADFEGDDSFIRNKRKISKRETSLQDYPGSNPYIPVGDFHAMDCTDMVIGSVRGNLSRIGDYYSRDRSTPHIDSFWGGMDSLTLAAGFELDDMTTIVFRKKLSAGDEKTDHSIVDEMMHVIWARGQEQGKLIHKPPSGVESGDILPDFYKPDELKYHGQGNQRGKTEVNFFHENVPIESGKFHCRGEWSHPPNCALDDCEYKASWELLPGNEDIRFTIFTKHSDKWTGIAFSHDTRMNNTDAIIGWVNEKGSHFLMDTWITGYQNPILDGIQNIINESGMRNSSGTTLVFTRKRDTDDKSQDLAFTDTECHYMIFPYQGGHYNAVNKKIKKHEKTPLISEERICIRSCQDSYMPGGTVEHHTVAVRTSTELSAVSSVKPYSTSTIDSRPKYQVDIKILTKHNLAPQADILNILKEKIRKEVTEVLHNATGFQEVEVVDLIKVDGSPALIAKMNIAVDGLSLNEVEENELKIENIINSSVSSGQIGGLSVDADYLVLQYPEGYIRDKTMEITPPETEASRRKNEHLIAVYAITAAVIALGLLVIIQIICTIHRRQKAKHTRTSKERLITNSGWKDFSTTASSNYSYEPFADDDPASKVSKNPIGSMAGPNLRGNSLINGSTRGGYGPNFTDTRSLSRNPRMNEGERIHYSRRSESLPRPAPPTHPAFTGNGYATHDRAYRHPNSNMRSPTELQPDFYFMPSQRRYSGEVVRVYVDYNNPNYTGK